MLVKKTEILHSWTFLLLLAWTVMILPLYLVLLLQLPRTLMGCGILLWRPAVAWCNSLVRITPSNLLALQINPQLVLPLVMELR